MLALAWWAAGAKTSIAWAPPRLNPEAAVRQEVRLAAQTANALACPQTRNFSF
jgi:hypothetical protein